MRTLGIDPGIWKVGYGIVEKKGNCFSVISTGFIVPPKNLKYKDKFSHIAKEVEKILENANMDFVAIEEIYIAKNVQIALKIGQVIGIIEAIAMRHNIDFETIPPREVKKCLTGIGSADKGQVKFMVETITGYKNFKNVDESDAVAVAISSFYLKEENDLLYKWKDS
ncbi:MAG TPA: crossover junction endodeoxyribonuclease RuvC [Candidatus Ratteibacteria bacterium]|nr:crossover junction endodeoxyribonuclease RuvC [bacterium]HRR95559.1 crossover junction endodeoxyribonuclease RuvC [Candidatus Ratteibacteria bacterium]